MAPGDHPAPPWKNGDWSRCPAFLAAAGIAGAIGEGGAGVVMRNDRGVEVRMLAETTGVTLSLGATGVKMVLED